MKNINQKNFTRQGDVVIMPIKKLPKDLTKVDGDKILQDSETQGKFHHFKPDADVTIYERGTIKDADTITPDTDKYIVVGDTAVLYHGRGFHPLPSEETVTDHHALTIQPGIYRIGIQQVYDKESRQPRRNTD